MARSPVNEVLIVQSPQGFWGAFLKDYFSDTPATVHIAHETAQAANAFDQLLPAVVFLDPALLNKTLLQKIKVRRNTDPVFRVCRIGGASPDPKEFSPDAVFPEAPVFSDFNKQFIEILPMPQGARLLVVDDEREIGELVRDYFEGRKSPSFEVEHVMNGEKAFAAIARQKPDVIILDVKMPVMDGREFYAKLQSRNPRIPVIVFFDSISGEEVSEIRKCGNPAVVEKGYAESSLPSLLLLVKKLIYFRPETRD